MPSRIHKQLFVLCTLFLFPVFSHAQVVINEISYSPQSKSWIEIYNGSASAIDLTQYKILDAGAAVNGHGITVISGTNPLPPQGYAVIAKDPTLFPSVSFSLFKSSLGANTSGDTLSLKSGSSVVDSVSFSNTQGANGDGNSLQKQADGTWIPATPTPGALNSNTPASSGSSSSSNSSSASSTDTTASSSNSSGNTNNVTTNTTETISTHYSYLPLSDFQAQQNLSVSAGRARLAAVRNPLQFQAEANIPDDTVTYVWTFGDGTTQTGKMVRHLYEYPGTYAVVLNASLPDVQAVSRTTVTVVDPKLEVVEANNQYIKIKNNASKEINVYGWEIISGGRSFSFPLDTIITAGESVCFPADVTGLSPIGSLDVKILPVSEAPLTVAVSPRVASSSDTALLEKKRTLMYEELITLKQEADALATARPSESAPASSDIPNTDNTEVAAPIGAAVSSSWLDSLKHFFFGTQ